MSEIDFSTCATNSRYWLRITAKIRPVRVTQGDVDDEEIEVSGLQRIAISPSES